MDGVQAMDIDVPIERDSGGPIPMDIDFSSTDAGFQVPIERDPGSFSASSQPPLRRFSLEIYSESRFSASSHPIRRESRQVLQRVITESILAYQNRPKPACPKTVARLLKKVDIHAIPEGECSICLDDFQGKICVTTPCKHTFHKVCIMKWLGKGKNNVCPLCRFQVYTSIELKSLFQLEKVHVLVFPFHPYLPVMNLVDQLRLQQSW